MHTKSAWLGTGESSRFTSARSKAFRKYSTVCFPAGAPLWLQSLWQIPQRSFAYFYDSGWKSENERWGRKRHRDRLAFYSVWVKKKEKPKKSSQTFRLSAGSKTHWWVRTAQLGGELILTVCSCQNRTQVLKLNL